MLGEFLRFHLVKKIGEGTYLNEDHFIIERLRRERALDIDYIAERKNRKRKSHNRNGRFRFS
jgi:hypothetical protein